MLDNGRLNAKAEVLPLPRMLAAGLEVPQSRAENWAPLLGRASFDINPREATTLNVILIHSDKLQASGVERVYDQIQRHVNNFRAAYRFSERPYQMIRAGKFACLKMHLDAQQLLTISSQLLLTSVSTR